VSVTRQRRAASPVRSPSSGESSGGSIGYSSGGSIGYNSSGNLRQRHVSPLRARIDDRLTTTSPSASLLEDVDPVPPRAPRSFTTLPRRVVHTGMVERPLATEPLLDVGWHVATDRLQLEVAFIAEGNRQRVLLTRQGEVYLLPYQKYHFGFSIDRRGRKPRVIYASKRLFHGERIHTAVCGPSGSAFITDSFTLFLWGDFLFDNYPLPRLVHFSSVFRSVYRVTQVAVGSGHVVILARAGGASHVITMGNNHKGQLGIGSASEISIQQRNEPTLVNALTGHDVVWVAARDNRSAVVTADGHLYAWGENLSAHSMARLVQDRAFLSNPGSVRVRQRLLRDCPSILGFENKILDEVSKPSLVEFGGVRRVWFAQDCVFCLTVEGFLYVAGHSSVGLLGLGRQCTSVRGFQQIILPTQVVSFSCGDTHATVATAGGALFAWGKLDKQDFDTPTLVDLEGNTAFRCFSGPRTCYHLLQLEPFAGGLNDARLQALQYHDQHPSVAAVGIPQLPRVLALTGQYLLRSLEKVRERELLDPADPDTNTDSPPRWWWTEDANAVRRKGSHLMAMWANGKEPRLNDLSWVTPMVVFYVFDCYAQRLGATVLPLAELSRLYSSELPRVHLVYRYASVLAELPSFSKDTLRFVLRVLEAISVSDHFAAFSPLMLSQRFGPLFEDQQGLDTRNVSIQTPLFQSLLVHAPLLTMPLVHNLLVVAMLFGKLHATSPESEHTRLYEFLNALVTLMPTLTVVAEKINFSLGFASLCLIDRPIRQLRTASSENHSTSGTTAGGVPPSTDSTPLASQSHSTTATSGAGQSDAAATPSNLFSLPSTRCTTGSTSVPTRSGFSLVTPASSVEQRELKSPIYTLRAVEDAPPLSSVDDQALARTAALRSSFMRTDSRLQRLRLQERPSSPQHTTSAIFAMLERSKSAPHTVRRSSRAGALTLVTLPHAVGASSIAHRSAAPSAPSAHAAPSPADEDRSSLLGSFSTPSLRSSLAAKPLLSVFRVARRTQQPRRRFLAPMQDLSALFMAVPKVNVESASRTLQYPPSFTSLIAPLLRLVRNAEELKLNVVEQVAIVVRLTRCLLFYDITVCGLIFLEKSLRLDGSDTSRKCRQYVSELLATVKLPLAKSWQKEVAQLLLRILPLAHEAITSKKVVYGVDDLQHELQAVQASIEGLKLETRFIKFLEVTFPKRF